MTNEYIKLTLLKLGGYSLAGRALDCDSKGRRFESFYPPLKFLINKTKTKKQDNKTIRIVLTKNLSQFYFNMHNIKEFSCSTGLVIKSLGKMSRSVRRNKIGWNIFFNFLLKKINNILSNNLNNIILKINSINSIEIIKKNIDKIVSSSRKIKIALKVKKNFSNHNFKKISFIKKRLRKKFILD